MAARICELGRWLTERGGTLSIESLTTSHRWALLDAWCEEEVPCDTFFTFCALGSPH